jgi:hypothetical protein
MIIELYLDKCINDVPNYKLGIYLLKLIIKIMGGGKINRIAGEFTNELSKNI